MAHDIFISHAAEDRTVANSLVAGLEENGITCWIAPRDVMAGADYAQAIVSGISGASAMVLVFSEHSNGSQHIGREVERAVSRGMTIIPFRIDEVEPSAAFEYFISSSQWLDATAGSTEDHIAELTSTIRVVVYGQEPETRREAGEVLSRIIGQYGPGLADDPRRVKSLLRDIAGEHRSEVAALVAAAEEGVGAALLHSSQGVTPESTRRLAYRLQENRALTEEAAVWAVEAWSHALGVLGPTPDTMTTPVTTGLPETVAAVPPVEEPPVVGIPPAREVTPEPAALPAQPATIPAGPASGREAVAPGGTPGRPAEPPKRAGRTWLVPAAIGAAAVAGVIGAVTLLGGGNGDGGTPATGSGVTTTAPRPTTTAVDGAAFFTFDGLTAAAVASRYPGQAAAVGLSGGCADLEDLAPVDAVTDRLEPGETFVWGTFAAPFCDAELWGIANPQGILRELTVQVPEPNPETVRLMTDMARALVATVGFPEADDEFPAEALESFGWLSASDPASHEGNAVVGAVQLGTFLHDGGFTFYLIPAT